MSSVSGKMIFSFSNESAIKKKLVEIHDCDGVTTFDSESVVVLVESMLNILTSRQTDGMQNGIADHVLGGIPNELHSVLHKISCVLSCKCSGGDTDASAMEILEILSSYEWEAKFAIVLATFVVEYAQFSHVTKLYKNNPLGEILAILKQIPDNIEETLSEIKSKFNTIIEVSIKVIRSISKFSILPSKYISKDVKLMADALNQIPSAVYLMTKFIVHCTSHLTQSLAPNQTSSYTEETWNFTSIERTIISIHDTFKKQHEQCLIHVEGKKQIKHIVKLKLKFDKTAVYANNQKILQLIINNKDSSLPPIACGGDKTTEVWVEALRGKTVLLLLSDLDISNDDISILSRFYEESRSNKELQYEIVWLPIVENIQQDDSFNKRIEDLKLKMPWYSLQHPGLLRAGVVKFVKEEWHYSNKSILVALDPRGKVANLNAFQMLSTWGNAAYPFTKSRELDVWHRKEWSLELLVGGIDQNISKWIKEEKIICLYGSEDHEWIDNFITRAKKVEEYAGINLEMVYIGENTSKEVTGALTGRSLSFEPESSRLFWRRIEGMGRSVAHVGARVSKTKEAITVEVRNIHRLRQSGGGWALISQGAGLGAGKIARGKDDVMLKALEEFENWSVEAKNKGFVVGLNGYLVGQQLVPEMHVCTECHRPM